MNFPIQILFNTFCQNNERKNKLKLKKSLSLGFMSVVLPSQKFDGKQWFLPYYPFYCRREILPFTLHHLHAEKGGTVSCGLFTSPWKEAGKGMFVNIVSGVTGYSCNKTHSGEKLIASVCSISEPLPRGTITLDHTCFGEQSLFFKVHFVSGVTVSGVTML